MSVIAELDLGLGQIILILLVVLLLYGARKLPDLARRLQDVRPLDEDEEQEAKFNWWVMMSLLVVSILIVCLVAREC